MADEKIIGVALILVVVLFALPFVVQQAQAPPAHGPGGGCPPRQRPHPPGEGGATVR